MKKNYLVLLNQLDGNLASDVSTSALVVLRGMKTSVETR